MSKPLEALKTMHQSMSCKTFLIKNHQDLRQGIRDFFEQTYALYEQLFDLLATDEAFYFKHEPLRHPLIFYYGHTASAYLNKCYDAHMISERVNSEYENIFAVGVDEMDWDDLNNCHYDWPSVAATHDFRAKVKQVILNIIDHSTTDRIDSWHSDMWVILLSIEHERIHLETSAVIIRRAPVKMIRPVEAFV